MSKVLMALPSSRWLLPLGHLFVDTLVLALWIGQGHQLLGPKKTALFHQPFATDVLFLQESGVVSFDVRYVDPSPNFLFLTAGNIPAAFVSASFRPRAHIQTGTKLWDPAWFLIHESVSCLLWFLVAVWTENGRARANGVMLGYLAARIGAAPFQLFPIVAEVGWKLEVFFWLALATYVVALAIGWSFGRVLKAPR
ncbi:MAG TPA: hypothetical protein VMH80_00905 [Bryobacteraceae bacterium]|nr:hypothetical protein [Bryobacteraceae bacterium]